HRRGRYHRTAGKRSRGLNLHLLLRSFGASRLTRWQNVDQKPPPSLRKSFALPCSRSPSARGNGGQSSARSLTPSEFARGTTTITSATAPPKPSASHASSEGPKVPRTVRAGLRPASRRSEREARRGAKRNDGARSWFENRRF